MSDVTDIKVKKLSDITNGLKLYSIPNIEGYLITEKGDIYSLKTQKFLIPRLNSKGYLDINLSIKGKKTKFFLHKLVAITFLGISTLPVSFKDKNKSNCSKDNIIYKK